MDFYNYRTIIGYACYKELYNLQIKNDNERLKI